MSADYEAWRARQEGEASGKEPAGAVDAGAAGSLEAASLKDSMERMLAGEGLDKKELTAEEELRGLREEVASLRQIAVQHQEQAKPKLARSTMKDKEKLEYIRQHGIDKYKEIPWD